MTPVINRHVKMAAILALSISGLVVLTATEKIKGVAE